MKKIIKEVDEKQGIVQVTIADERWYLKPSTSETGIPEYKAVPSVTWIASKYPKGIAFYKWLADKGWDEAEAIKQAAADKGSKVHLAIVDVIEGKEVRIDSKYINKTTEQLEELTLEECDAILSFVKWRNENNPISLLWEKVLFSDEYNTAGTLDHLYRLPEEDPNTLHLQDFKSGQTVWPEYELQLSAYETLLIENILNGNIHIPNLNPEKPIKVILEVLQVGYRRNKNGYKENIIENKFLLFLAAQQIWQNEHGNEHPTKKDYPIILSPEVKAEIAVNKTVRPTVKKLAKSTT